MLGHSILKNSALESVIASQSQLKPDQNGLAKRGIVADLLLTALIDAFSILVIFLLMSFSSAGEILFMGKGQELPKASQTEALERNTLIKVEGDKIFLEDKEVALEGLVQALLDQRAAWQSMHAGEEFPGLLTIQADRRMKYEFLNNVVLASSQSGFSDIKFAVIVK